MVWGVLYEFSHIMIVKTTCKWYSNISSTVERNNRKHITHGGLQMTITRANVNYKPLWKLLIDKNMSKVQLREATSISRSTIVKMTNNEYVAMDVLVRICVALNCGLDDIVEIEK